MNLTRCLRCGTRLAGDSIAAGYAHCSACEPTRHATACANGHRRLDAAAGPCPRCTRIRAHRAAIRRGLS
jgi:hypothetical protein